MDDQTKTEPYEAPAITDIASVHELTLTGGRKYRKNTPDGYYTGHHILTS